MNGPGMIADWRRIPFVMVDSPQTKVFEDAVAVEGEVRKKDWSAELKVIHPLPLRDAVSLGEREEQVCLGISSALDAQGISHPSISLVMARDLTRISDCHAKALLEDEEIENGYLGAHASSEPELVKPLKAQLKLMRATALKISLWRARRLTPEHSLTILLTHAQTVAIQASRNLRGCPSLIVLRHHESRVLTDAQAQKRGMFALTEAGSVTMSVGRAIPTLLQGGETANSLDSLRLKDRGNSGAINSTQLVCALLGIEPIPEDLVRQGVRGDSILDRWKRGGPLPKPLAAAIKERRNAIREVLNQATQGLLMREAPVRPPDGTPGSRDTDRS